MMQENSRSSSTPCSVESVLPPYMRTIIPFESFTRMQSETLDTWYADSNLLISAPTGAGKTVCFELAILRLIHSVLSAAKHSSVKQLPSRGLDGKIVYISPTKSLCVERAEDWKVRFAPLLLRIELVTGDSQIFSSDSRLANADVILTTSEKWDSITRNLYTGSTSNIMSKITLLLLDEVHQLGDSRGAAFETIVTRMLVASDECDYQASSGGHKEPIASLRVVAASATIQNLRDVADWLRVPEDGLHNFDETYRPVPLDYIVKGYYSNNPWQYSKVFDKHILNVLQTYAHGKPAIVFCTTRRQTADSAKGLLDRLGGVIHDVAKSRGNVLTRSLTSAQRKRLFDSAQTCGDVTLRSLLPAGIAIHNADMSSKSRQLVETLFKDRLIPCLFSTSTLAQGVNLPARLVVICGTCVYHDGALREYDRNLFLQMCGRAGRPGLDKRGVVVVMTKNSTKDQYETARNCCEVIESQLTGLLERYLNVEIARNSVRDIASAALFLMSSFYWIRWKKIRLSNAASDAIAQKRAATDLAVNAINELVRVKLVAFDDDVFGVSCTKLGICMAKYSLSYQTVQRFVREIPNASSPSHVMDMISRTDELTNGVFVRRLEKKRLNEINSGLRLPIKGRVKEVYEKVSVLLQCAIGGEHMLQAKDFSLCNEADRLLQTASRICHGILDIALEGIVLVPFDATNSILQVCRGIINKCLWNSVSVLRELCKLSDTHVRELLRRGFTTVSQICELGADGIINLLKCTLLVSRQVVKRLEKLPKFCVNTNVIREHGQTGCIAALEIRAEVFTRRLENGRGRQFGQGFIIVGSPSRGLLMVKRFTLEDGVCHAICTLPDTRGARNAQCVDVIVGCDYFIGVDVCERHDDTIASVTDAGASTGAPQTGVVGHGSHSLKNGVRNDVRLSACRGMIEKRQDSRSTLGQITNVLKQQEGQNEALADTKTESKTTVNSEVGLMHRGDVHVTDVSEESTDENNEMTRVGGVASPTWSKHMYDDVFRTLF